MNSPLAAKPHYPILDGLRGVAALMVVAFHLLEAHAANRFEQVINHGYLAVDFFFLLSGFVIGYAYDDRWGKITLAEFLKRRVIRLQPMVIMGMIVGAALFYFQDSVLWPNIDEVPWWQVVGIMLIGFALIPVPPSMDIRGWIEMYPLNGPGWSLFFEYVATVLYALWIRKFSNGALSILVFLSGVILIHLAVTNPSGDVIGGWSLEPTQLYIGFARVMFPFFAGLLLSRTIKITNVKNAFVWCSLLVMIVLAMPRIGTDKNVWTNGLYDSLSIVFVFPCIIYLGASGKVNGRFGNNICKFLADISYPIYITHYPIIYVYTGWVHDHKFSIGDTLHIAIVAFLLCVVLAYASLKFYDEPLRKWLSKKLLAERSPSATKSVTTMRS